MSGLGLGRENEFCFLMNDLILENVFEADRYVGTDLSDIE